MLRGFLTARPRWMANEELQSHTIAEVVSLNQYTAALELALQVFPNRRKNFRWVALRSLQSKIGFNTRPVDWRRSHVLGEQHW